MNEFPFRTGFGIDFHQLATGRTFYLGGVRIDFEKGGVGHSDADVLLHAICDALLGAAALGDIGIHFPDTDATFKNIDSKILLRKTIELIHASGFLAANIDSTICLETPKLHPYKEAMQEVIAEICQIGKDAVSIKATTSEKMGFVGRGEGVAAYASVLIYRRNSRGNYPGVSH